MQDSAQIYDCTAVIGGGVTVGNGTVQNNDKSVFTMTGNASVYGCTATQKGAGVYIDVSAVMNISGSPTFGGTGITATGDLDNTSGNLLTGTISATNGDKTYTRARQDIYIVGYADTVAPSLVVTGTLSGNDGAIWVWAETSPHYKETEQFALINSGVSPGTLSVFRDARTDADSEATKPLYGVRSETNTSHVVWGYIDGARVAFKKVNGFGNGLGGAGFSLYKDAACTAANIVTVTLADNSTSTVITSATTADSLNGIEIGDVSFRAPVGIYYMKEINTPTGYQENTNIYIVLVGSGNVTVPGTRTGVWAATGVLGNISQDDINSQRGSLTAGKYEKDSAVFLIDSTTDKAVTTPDIATYGIMNISTVERMAILKKNNEAFNPLPKAQFQILRYDRTLVSGIDINGNTTTTFTTGTSDVNGVYFIDEFPFGTYYIHETQTPNGYQALSDGTNWYTLTVNGDGVTVTGRLNAAP